MSTRPLMDDTLLVLKTCGFICIKPNFWSNARKNIILLIFFASFIDLAVWNILNQSEHDMEAIFAVFSLLEVALKMVMLIWLRKTILKIFFKMEEFWPLDKYGPHQEKVNKRIFNVIKFCLKSGTYFMCCPVLLFFIKPFFGTSEDILPYKSYLFETTGMFGCIYVLEVLANIVLMPAYFGFVFVYIALITNIICEFKLLKIGFSKIPISRSSKSDDHTTGVLKELVDHHNLVLECCEYLKDIFYIPLLCQLTISSFVIVFSLMCLILNGNFTDVSALTYETTILFYALQLCMYCYPGSILISESTEISFAVYQSDWWIKSQPELRKACVMIIQRANKPALLSAGGIADVTLETFSNIMKSSLSFFTCVQAMYADTV